MVKHAHDPANNPQTFIEKAKAKLRSLEESGEIEASYVFEHQLQHFWTLMKRHNPSEEIQNFDLGFGGRKIEIELGPSSAKKFSQSEKSRTDGQADQL